MRRLFRPAALSCAVVSLSVLGVCASGVAGVANAAPVADSGWGPHSVQAAAGDDSGWGAGAQQIADDSGWGDRAQ
ncbi:hypothetical protein [Streptomyces sp. NPDC051677]|uniref:hypothetical protein n=1 Tax=Streptomyces sp. NPDC051677 TaxID=3365669 RepID=UPI0037D6075F